MVVETSRADGVQHKALMCTLDAQVLARAGRLGTATIHEAAGRVGALPSLLKPLSPAMHFAGRALPVRSPPGDNLWLHRALAEVSPGDVLVVDVGDGREYGYWGEVMATAAVTRGAAGFVITGGVRDSRQLITLGLPTFSASIAIRGTVKDQAGDGSVGEPIRIGDVLVRRGDLIVGDADGLVCIPADRARDVVELSERRDADEVEILDRIRAGELTLDIFLLRAQKSEASTEAKNG